MKTYDPAQVDVWIGGVKCEGLVSVAFVGIDDAKADTYSSFSVTFTDDKIHKPLKRIIFVPTNGSYLAPTQEAARKMFFPDSRVYRSKR